MDEIEESSDEGGGAGWLATFADLMSLLMCFFVLLQSFSEMDVLKFKRLAGSMKSAFGVQQKMRVNDPPKGTSIIAQEFSLGTPSPTPLNEIWQKTTDESRNSLDVACQDQGSSNTGEIGDAQRMIIVDKVKDMVGETEQDAIDMTPTGCISVLLCLPPSPPARDSSDPVLSCAVCKQRARARASVCCVY